MVVYLKVKQQNLPYDPVIPFLSIYPKEMKTYIYRTPHIGMLIVELFILTKTRNNKNAPKFHESAPNAPWKDEQNAL